MANEDVFRVIPHEVSQETRDKIATMATMAQDLLDVVTAFYDAQKQMGMPSDPRSLATFKTNLQTAMFWANHGLT